MEKEAADELQLLGKRGIVGKAFTNLPRSRFLWALILSLLVPLSFEFLGQKIFCPLLLQFNEKQMEAVVPSDGTTRREFTSEWRELLVVVATYIAFVLAVMMLSSTAVVCTVVSIYTANTEDFRLSYVRVLSADFPRVWKRLTLRFLCFSIISLGFLAAFLLAIILLLIIFFPSVGGKAFLLGVILVIIVVVFSLQLYITIMWYLASIISALDDKSSGLPFIPKSSNSKENRKTALPMFILNIIFGGYIGGLFWYEAVEGRSHGVGIAARAVYPTLLVGCLCFINSKWILLHSVVYFLCNSYYHGDMDDNFSFKVYNVDNDEPPKTASNS